jgi:hypothetical protein
MIYFFSLFVFIVVLGGGTLQNLQKFLQYIKYIILEFTPSTILVYPSLPPLLLVSIQHSIR